MKNLKINESFIKGYMMSRGTFGIRKRKMKKTAYMYPYIRVIVPDARLLEAVSQHMLRKKISHTICAQKAAYITSKKSLTNFLNEFEYADFPVWSQKPKYKDVMALMKAKK